MPRVRLALLLIVEVALVLGLLVGAAALIPHVAPPSGVPTPTVPPGALWDCPHTVPGCR